MHVYMRNMCLSAFPYVSMCMLKAWKEALNVTGNGPRVREASQPQQGRASHSNSVASLTHKEHPKLVHATTAEQHAAPFNTPGPPYITHPSLCRLQLGSCQSACLLYERCLLPRLRLLCCAPLRLHQALHLRSRLHFGLLLLLHLMYQHLLQPCSGQRCPRQQHPVQLKPPQQVLRPWHQHAAHHCQRPALLQESRQALPPLHVPLHHARRR